MEPFNHKICFLHTDPKFCSGDYFFVPNSTYIHIYITDDKNKVKYDQKGVVYSFGLKHRDLVKVVQLANQCDIIVIYNLDATNSYICNRIEPRKKVLWRFFGAELYGRMVGKVLSEKTKRYIDNEKISWFKHLGIVTHLIFLYGLKYRTEFSRAIRRCDAVLMLYYDEYVYLSKEFKLPPFVQIPYKQLAVSLVNTPKEELILLGNSRNKFNNHLEVIDIVKMNCPSSSRVILPFNYGEESQYSETVYKNASTISQISMLTSFVPATEYELLYSRAAAFVFNGWRQMAMGNIFLALKNRVKVYLNIKNTAYNWLKSERFSIFTIEDFEKDIATGNIFLSEVDANNNLKALDSLANKYSYQQFRDKFSIMLRF